MLNIYKSNKIEVISELLAKELIINPPLITDKIDIAVPNYFVGKWLREQITVSNKISALYEFKTISKFTECLLTKFFPENNMEAWNFESIKWGILDSLEELNTYEESMPLKNWIDNYMNNKKIIDRDIYSLTNKIAKNFVEYLIFRPELIAHWEKYGLQSTHLFKNLKTYEFWQPILYKLLQQKIPDKPSCLYMLELINKIEIMKIKYKSFLSRPIYIVSENNLSKLQINFYLKISEFTKVNLYILSPGNDLWNRINTEEGEIDFSNHFIKENLSSLKIENIFGKYGANYQKLIEEMIYNQGVNFTNNLLFIDPTISSSKKKNIPLLNQLQKKLIENNNIDLSINKEDDSVIFRGHINQLSQLEYIRYKILKILASNDDIKYSDIAIVTPQVSNIKPYLKYIFNNELINGTKIPYFFVEEEYKDTSKVYEFLIEIIDMSAEKITLEKIENLLSKRSTQYIYDFDFTEKDEVIKLLNDLGFHWGVDTEERLGEQKNNLKWCINRIILGLLYDENYILNEYKLKSFSPNNTSLDLNKWVKILLQLIKFINSLRGSYSYSDWVRKIIYIIKEFNNYNDKLNLEISYINRILDDFSIHIISDEIISLAVFKEILNTCFKKVNFNQELRTNKILVSDIEKVRLLPHKVILLIDMNSIFYPRSSNNEETNLLKKQYVLGDPSIFDREKYFFIELLIACRNKLIVSWVNNDNDNNRLDISLPIKELINYFEKNFTSEQRKNLIKDFGKEKKELSNKEISNKTLSCYSLIDKLDWQEKIFDTQNYKLAELIYWFKTPQLYWLNQKNISPKNSFLKYGDDEYLSNFQKYKIFTKIIQKIEIDSHDFINELYNLDLTDQLIGNGIITPKNSIFIKENEIRNLVESLALNLDKYSLIKRIYIKSKSNKEEYFVSDNAIIELIHSNLNLNRLSEVWIRLLFISALNNKFSRTKIIFRKDNQYKTAILDSPGTLKARKILEEYISIFKNCSEACFPLPPESTYKYVEAKINIKNENKAFEDTWVGNNNFRKGERDKIEMQICFGNKRDPEFFLENKKFHNLALKIYEPLLQALKK